MTLFSFSSHKTLPATCWEVALLSVLWWCLFPLVICSPFANDVFVWSMSGSIWYLLFKACVIDTVQTQNQGCSAILGQRAASGRDVGMWAQSWWIVPSRIVCCLSELSSTFSQALQRCVLGSEVLNNEPGLRGSEATVFCVPWPCGRDDFRVEEAYSQRFRHMFCLMVSQVTSESRADKKMLAHLKIASFFVQEGSDVAHVVFQLSSNHVPSGFGDKV